MVSTYNISNFFKTDRCTAQNNRKWRISSFVGLWTGSQARRYKLVLIDKLCMIPTEHIGDIIMSPYQYCPMSINDHTIPFSTQIQQLKLNAKILCNVTLPAHGAGSSVCCLNWVLRSGVVMSREERAPKMALPTSSLRRIAAACLQQNVNEKEHCITCSNPQSMN